MRHKNRLSDLKVGDHITVYRTNARYFESAIMFSGMVDGFETWYGDQHVLLHSENGDKHRVWNSPLMRAVKTISIPQNEVKHE